jgi:hypothetical protein
MWEAVFIGQVRVLLHGLQEKGVATGDTEVLQMWKAEH